MEKQPGLLDVLLEVRANYDERISFLPYIGEPSVERLLGFVYGYAVACFHHNIRDSRADEFFLWLRDVKKEFPGQGWHLKFLHDCQGNEKEAVRKLLDFAAEFAALSSK